VQAATAAQLVDRGHEHARAALEAIEDASREAITELRTILGVLRDPDHPDAPNRPAPGVENIAELVQQARDAGLDIQLEITGAHPDQLADAVSLAAYRIVQESLTNARRHAGGAPVRVHLTFQPSELAVAVENDAGTASTVDNGALPGVGIIGMAERAAAVGGSLRAARLPSGFRVDAKLPYAPGEA
jgi:signal transduction histidine kinase